MRRIRIGFHGVPGAGKTVLQVMYYGFRDLGDGAIVFTDQPTIQYLRPRWDQICQGQTPPASAMGRPDRLLWRVEGRDGACEVEAMDFAGALVDPGADAGIAGAVRDEVREFLATCDGLFLLVDAGNPNPAQLDALAHLVELLRGRSPTENGGRNRPVALLLTKFDRLGPLDPDPEVNQQRALEYLRGHRVFRQIDPLLRRRQEGSWWFRVFPVSAFGTSCPEGRAPSQDQLKPYNLHEPLRWMIGEVGKELDRSHASRRRRRLKVTALSVAAAAALTAAGYDLSHRLSASLVANVERFCKDHPAAEDLPLRISARQRFLDSVWVWRAFTPASVRQGLAREIHADRLALFADQFRRESEASAARLPADAAADYYVWDNLLASFTDVPDAPERGDAEDRREAARRRWDAYAWGRATAADTPAASDYEAVRNLYREWLRVPGTDPAQRGRADNAVTRLERAWDREQYEKVYESAKGASTWEAYDKAVTAARPYESADRIVKRMAAPVRQLLAWADAIHDGKVVWDVRVESATIHYASQLRDKLDFVNADVCFVLSINSWASDTRRKFVEHTKVGEAPYELGPYPVVWGRPLRVLGGLTAYSKSGAAASGPVDFTPGFDGSNTSVSMTVNMVDAGGEGCSAVLHWHCDGLAAPPPLPPYEN